MEMKNREEQFCPYFSHEFTIVLEDTTNFNHSQKLTIKLGEYFQMSQWRNKDVSFTAKDSDD